MSRSFQELRQLSDDELISAHDSIARHTSVGVSYYLEELSRRETSRREAVMIRLTWAIFGLTCVNVVVVVLTLVGN